MLSAAWDSSRELGSDGPLRVVDKPAGLSWEEDTRGGRVGLARQLGLTVGVRCLWEVPRRASGVVALGPRGAVVPRGLRFGVVVALEGGGWPGTAPAGDEPTWEVERLSQAGARSLVRVWADGPLDPLLTAIRRRCRVVGDELPVPSATRLLLHVERVRGAFEAHAPVPAEFHSWLAGKAQRGPELFEQALREGLPARFSWCQGYEAYRLVSEQAGELAGVTVDRYGAFALLSVSSEEALLQAPRMAQCLMDHGATGVYLKQRLRADLRHVDFARVAAGAPLLGESAAPQFVVRLGSLRAEVRLADGHSTGLFLDQRDNWTRFGESCGSRSLLNLFCYTGLFTVAAAAAGARETTSVDLSRRALRRAARNLDLCALSASHHRLLASDGERWLDRAARRGSRFERIVLDPPSFGTRGRGEVLSLQRDLQRLFDKALRCLDPRQGRLLCVNHQRGLSALELAELAVESASRVHPSAEVEVRSLVGPWDCPTLPGVTPTKAVILRLDGAQARL